MKILITGSNGQFAQTFKSDVLDTFGKNLILIETNKETLDLANHFECYKLVKSEKPDFVINAGAITSVDMAEINKEKTFNVNAYVINSFLKALEENNKGILIQISTDYVFDGYSNIPYKPSNRTNPLNIYGLSKSLSERIVLDFNKKDKRAFIFRTSWLVSEFRKNFLLTILKLNKEKEVISCIDDQVG